MTEWDAKDFSPFSAPSRLRVIYCPSSTSLKRGEITVTVYLIPHPTLPHHTTTTHSVKRHPITPCAARGVGRGWSRWAVTPTANILIQVQLRGCAPKPAYPSPLWKKDYPSRLRSSA
jgi:hypothetical protein